MESWKMDVIAGYEAVMTASSFVSHYHQVIAKCFNSRSKNSCPTLLSTDIQNETQSSKPQKKAEDSPAHSVLLLLTWLPCLL